MSELDDKIRKALRTEDAELLNRFEGEPSFLEMMLETLRGRNRRIMMYTIFWMLAFLVAGIFAAIKFFQAEATRDMLIWAVAVMFCITAVSMMKIMWWMDMNKNAVTREIKRLELQVATLAAGLKD